MQVSNHIPPIAVAANLPALNLRLIRQTENPKERLEISEASLEALREVPRYEEVASFTQQALQGVTGTMRRQAMISAALSAMAACPSMICVGHALIGSAPEKHQLDLSDKVLTRVEAGSIAPELGVARRLLEDPVLSVSEKAGIVQNAIDGAGRAASLVEATSDMLEGRFDRVAHRLHATQVAIDAILPMVPSYSRGVLELAAQLLTVAQRPGQAVAVAGELFWAANEEPGRELTLSLHSASLKTRGEGKKELLEQGFLFLKEWSTVPDIGPAVDLVDRVASAAGERGTRVRQASLNALTELSRQQTPAMTVALQVVRMGRHTESQGGLAGTSCCQDVLIAVLEQMKSHVAEPTLLDEAITRIRQVESEPESSLVRSTRQAVIAGRALHAAEMH